MKFKQKYTPEQLLLIAIFGELAVRFAEIVAKPLSEITIIDLPFIRQMPVLPNGIIIYNVKSGDKSNGELPFTKSMKSNLIRYTKENAKSYFLKKNP